MSQTTTGAPAGAPITTWPAPSSASVVPIVGDGDTPAAAVAGEPPVPVDDHFHFVATLRLADQGAEVLPLYWPTSSGCCSCSAGRACGRNTGKHPIPENGHLDATSDPGQIVRWWMKNPRANVGIRPPADTVILDVDPRNGGATALVELLAGRPLPHTLTAQTGGGGLHIWLHCPKPAQGYRGKLTTGVDIKTHNGLVVAPPSLHASGGRYVWANDLQVAPAPDWLVPLIVNPPPTPRRRMPARYRTGTRSAQRLRVEALCNRIASVPEGGDHLTKGRNDALHWAAMRLVEDGLDDMASVEALRDAAASAGLADNEIKRTLRSGLRRAGSPLAEEVR